jgi:alcohol dehydrogenase class IV
MAHTSQSVIIEEGAIRQLRELLEDLNVKRIFFVVDKPAFEFSGAADALENCLSNYSVSWFSDFELNPKIEDAKRGISLVRKISPDVVIALGGGSSLDMAKIISRCGAQKGHPEEYVKGERVMKPLGPPMIAIPTTTGTGSEATHFAVVYIDGEKYSLAHKSLLPEYALIDPELTYSLPADKTAACGLDALCQSVESIWAVGATDESVEYGLEGLQLAIDHLEKAVCDPNPRARMSMARAAHLSGKAINISKTTAPHAVSYAITTGFQVPHGMAVALTLGSFLEYNYQVDEAGCSDPRGPASVRKRIDRILDLLGDGSMEQGQSRFRSLMKKINCPVKLREVGIQKSDLSTLVQKVNLERLSNNPRSIKRKGLLNLHEAIL